MSASICESLYGPFRYWFSGELAHFSISVRALTWSALSCSIFISSNMFPECSTCSCDSKSILHIPEKLLTISDFQDVLVRQHTISNGLTCFCAKLFPTCSGIDQSQVLRLLHYYSFSSGDCETHIDLFHEWALVLLDNSRVILQPTKMLNLIRSMMLC